MVTNTPIEHTLKQRNAELTGEIEELREKIRELQDTLDAIRSGEVDAIIIAHGENQKIYTLEGSDHPYRALVENIHEGALTLSRTGTILYTNTRFAEMVKTPPERIPGTSILDYVCPEHKTEMDEAISGILVRSCRTRIRIRQEVRGSLPALISMNPLSLEENTKISVVVTDRKEDEERIILQARMLDAVGDAVIAADTSNTIIYWNDAATKTYGWTAEEALGRKFGEVVTPVLSQNDAQEIAERLSMGEMWSGEYVIRHRDGHEFPIYANDAPVFNDDGDLIAIIGASHDITEQKRAEIDLIRKNEDLISAYEEISSTQEKLRQNLDTLESREIQLNEALAEKEVLLSEIHHRVKNNLTAFISLLSLEGSYEETERGRAFRKDLQSRARSMALIHETLYRTGKFSNVDMEIYLPTLVNHIADSYKGSLKILTSTDARGVVLDLPRATTAGLIINELVTNSFKYAFLPEFNHSESHRDPCMIQVSLTAEEGTYILIVSDNGCGLPPEFDPLTANSLGLKLVKFLARHQLRADVEIRGDKGTAFIFRLNNKENYT
ncbi:MAG TPA: PAS domain S-box protein [Methanospirillum sp.]|nr:PAS domain S-box protein [Methanospirillum sp.]